MSTLDRALRKQLADTIGTARQIAEEASADAVRRLGVIEDEAPVHLTPTDKALRVRLRAHARTLGDGWSAEKKRLLTTKHLEDEAAYEVWHRMLFGRFLIERGLLIYPDLGEPIDPKELSDLARDEGLSDPWALVERFAAPSLPAVFKPDDPVLAMTLDPALAKRLRDLVAAFPSEVFRADDSLGWTYQFWRTAEKDAVNKAGGKIGAAELPAVTQLFTEPYMVKFLLHNTLGAWWAGKVLAANPDLARDAADEQSLRGACAVASVTWDYLRFVRAGDAGPWRPAAGSFPGWPSSAAEITYCDPCCGSGHFLVEAFAILAAMRQHEEGLSDENAALAVLRDNLHGLELDGRCVQIAAFNVALAAWKVAGGPVGLPQPHIAWVGAPPPLARSEMAALANGDSALRGALVSLHDQFAQAPLLGSLLEVGAQDLLDADLREHGDAALTRLRDAEPERAEGAVAARGMLDATALLGRRYVLLATNVPFLGRGKQTSVLADHIAQRMSEAKPDLATAMLQRMLGMMAPSGAVASVTPQNWLFLRGYKALREKLLTSASLSLLAVLGEHGFESSAAAGAFTALVVLRNTKPDTKTVLAALDTNMAGDPAAKAQLLFAGEVRVLDQADQRRNPDATITTSSLSSLPRLGDYASFHNGIQTGDFERFGRRFFEVGGWPSKKWILQQTTVVGTVMYGGYENAILWDNGDGEFQQFVAERLNGNIGAWIRGSDIWGSDGILVSAMRQLFVSRYIGNAFDDNSVVIRSKQTNLLPAIWAYMSNPKFNKNVRQITRSLKVRGDMLKVSFDLPHWQAIAARQYPNGLPEPYSDDPTQWLFHGHPAFAVSGTELHVALARIAGYRWPTETDTTMRLADLAKQRAALATALRGTDSDGLLPIHGTGTDRPLADRLRALLAVAYGASVTPAQEADLIRVADAKLDKKEARDVSLEGWLRDRAFRQHCILFQHRPFLWHVWDGLKDGFSVFLHYHRLDYAALEKLTFTLLGDWIAKARAEGRTAHEGRAQQLQQRLRLILEGDQPHDIFVRWKRLVRQPIGWHPDLDDGVRINIRPFIIAEVLREQPRINWNKDRGTDVASAPWYHLGPTYGGKEGDRINDHHLPLPEKRAAQPQAKAS